MSEQTFARAMVKAPFGTLTIVASHSGVRFCMFDNDAHPKSMAGMHIVDDATHPVVAQAVQQLSEYLAGTRTAFTVPVDLEGTDFQIAAWNALSKVPYGHTWSYLQQATSIGKPTATRAIGAANGRNPVVVILPCHRIIGANGALTGFGGGISTKQWLLEHEKKNSAVHSGA